MIFHNRPTVGKKEIYAVKKAISSGYLSQGKEVSKFERHFANYMGIDEKNVVAVSNGTSALYLALWALGAKNKKTIYPTYSCSSIRNASALIGAKEKLCDVEMNSPNMSPLNGKEGDIIIAPHMYGFPINLLKRKGIIIIEDVCQSLGSTTKGKPLGLLGDLSIFSFYATKMITSCGQGGMIISKDKYLIKEIVDYVNFDNRRDKKKRFNFQMSDVQAAMGRVQFSRLNEFIEKRDKIFRYYKDLGLPLIDIKYKNENTSSVRYRIILMCKNPELIKRKLFLKNIAVINPLETQELLSENKQFKFAKKLTKSTISLPCYPSLKKSELIKIGKEITKLEKYFN